MGSLYRAVRDLDIYYMMGILAVLTMGTGLVLANPRSHTFDAAPWTTFAQLRLGPVHPSEGWWGIIIVVLALFQIVTVWQLADDENQHTSVLLVRIIWGLTCGLYFGIGSSFLTNNPQGLGYLLVLVPGCLISARVCVRVRHLVEENGGGQGG